jgi:hypothetical protein
MKDNELIGALVVHDYFSNCDYKSPGIILAVDEIYSLVYDIKRQVSRYMVTSELRFLT